MKIKADVGEEGGGVISVGIRPHRIRGCLTRKNLIVDYEIKRLDRVLTLSLGFGGVWCEIEYRFGPVYCVRLAFYSEIVYRF